MEDGRFASHLASLGIPTSDYEEVCIEDLRLAFAAADGEREAVATIERSMIEPVPRSIARMKPDARLVDEVRQALRTALLVGPVGGRPKLLEYKGRGPLAAWVRVVATRIAYDHLREQPTREDDGAAFETLADDADMPDVAHLKITYAHEVKAAFAEAAARLAPEERAVLRAHAVDGLTIDEIGALFQVHRATAARWVQHARTVLLDGLRDALAQRLGIEHDACQSLVALVRSRIDLSLERVLQTDD